LALLAASYLYITGYFNQGNQPLIVESLRKKTANPTPDPEQQSAEIVKLPAGTQTYRFSHGQDVIGPKPESITIDPLDPEPGRTQTVSIQVSADTPAKSATVEIITDSKTATQKLNFKDGQWQGLWTIDDTYNYQYGFRLILAGADTYDNTMWIRQ
jgi:hypothetical protein